MDWPQWVLVAIAVALVAIGAWSRVRRRQAGHETDVAPTASPAARDKTVEDPRTEPSRSASPSGTEDERADIIATEVAAAQGVIGPGLAEDPVTASVVAASMIEAAKTLDIPAALERAGRAEASASEAAEGRDAPPEAPSAQPASPADVEVAGKDPEHPFGPRSAVSASDGSGPEGWTVKGNTNSGLYHTPSSPAFKRTKAGVWFADEEAAEAAGFTRWDRRRRRA
jgi:hypothetical protein